MKRGKRWDQCSLAEAAEKVRKLSRQAVSKAILNARAAGDNVTADLVEQARKVVVRERYLARNGKDVVLAKEARIAGRTAAKERAELEFLSKLSMPVVGRESEWSVTDEGQIFSHTTQAWLKPIKSGGRPYYVVTARKNKTMYVHRIVAEAFISNPENKRTVNHKDGDKLNNSVSNLEWATHKENTAHAIDTGLWKPPVRGCERRSSKLNPDKAAEIRRLLSEGKTQTFVAGLFGVSAQLISLVSRGKLWELTI